MMAYFSSLYSWQRPHKGLISNFFMPDSPRDGIEEGGEENDAGIWTKSRERDVKNLHTGYQFPI